MHPTARLLSLLLAVFFFLVLTDARALHDIRSLLERGNEHWGSSHDPMDWPTYEVHVVYRADSRGPDEILKNGFAAWKGPSTSARYNLFNHIGGFGGFEKIEGDFLGYSGYISTTQSLERAGLYANNAKRNPKNTEKKAYIYKMQTSSRFVDVNASMRNMFNMGNKEHAALGHIPTSEIIGYVEATDDVMKDLNNAKFIDNKRFIKRSDTGTTIRPELFNFPPSHPNWKVKPWSTYLKQKHVPSLQDEYNKVLTAAEGGSMAPVDSGSSADENREKSKKARQMWKKKAKGKTQDRDSAKVTDSSASQPPAKDETAEDSAEEGKDKTKNRLRPNKGSKGDANEPDTDQIDEAGPPPDDGTDETGTGQGNRKVKPPRPNNKGSNRGNEDLPPPDNGSNDLPPPDDRTDETRTGQGNRKVKPPRPNNKGSNRGNEDLPPPDNGSNNLPPPDDEIDETRAGQDNDKTNPRPRPRPGVNKPRPSSGGGGGGGGPSTSVTPDSDDNRTTAQKATDAMRKRLGLKPKDWSKPKGTTRPARPSTTNNRGSSGGGGGSPSTSVTPGSDDNRTTAQKATDTMRKRLGLKPKDWSKPKGTTRPARPSTTNNRGSSGGGGGSPSTSVTPGSDDNRTTAQKATDVMRKRLGLKPKDWSKPKGTTRPARPSTTNNRGSSGGGSKSGTKSKPWRRPKPKTRGGSGKRQ